jgi:hypothetical protein
MAETNRAQRTGVAIAVGLVVVGIAWARCSKPTNDRAEVPDAASSASAPAEPRAGLGEPIAATHVGADVIVAALDVAAKGLRVQRIDPDDRIVADRVVLGDVAGSTDAEVKVAASPEGVAVTWRGLRSGKLVRQLVRLGPDLSARGEPAEVGAASCSTRDGLWSSDGVRASFRPWSGAPGKLPLPKDKEISLLCGQHRAFALVEDDDKTSLLPLVHDAGAPVTVVRDDDFGEDEQRELAEYNVGDDVGVVRLAASGALALREVLAGAVGPLRKLKTTIGRDDDIVAVDASAHVAVIVYTQEETPDGGADDPASTLTCTKVSAVRVDRETFEESTVELAPARCGYELGPFFTNALGDGVSVAWPERSGGGGHARAPIAGLAHVTVGRTGTPSLARSAEAADAMVDAGCDESTCYAVALRRSDGKAKILRYR